MAIPVAINGFGRIGRVTLRAMLQRKGEFDVVAINDLGDPQALAMLFKYDSVHGRFPGDIEIQGDSLVINGDKIKITSERNPAELPWKELGCQIALESTGFFTNRAADGKPGYDSHVEAGAQKVVISAPAKTPPDLTCVMGVNDDQLTADMKYVSNASCTTNCLAPMAKVLNDNFGLESGLMTTVHSYTNDQRTNDQIHSDPHRARAAALNIIPTSTGAAKAVGLVLPELNGKLSGISLRVPTPCGSVTDLVCKLEKKPSAEEINEAMKAASEGPMKGILEYNTDPIVSTDIIGNPHSSIFDAGWTMALEDGLVKVLSWYDNEFGYSNRTADLISKMASF